jgi:UDP:flavonoid glycosyltransferase YjiC (YdhE family)
MRIAVLTNGTRGDIQPYLSLGEELASRGHSVVLTVNKNLAAWAARSGLEIVSTEPDIEALFRPEDTRRAVARGDTLSVIKILVASIRASRRELIRACIHATQGADLIISTVLTAYLATAIAESSGIPHAVATTMPLQPTRQWTNLGWPIRDFGVATLNRLSHSLVIDMGWRLARDDLREARAMLGLSTLKRRPRWEELPSLQLYSPSLCARPADWDAKHEITGACGLPRALRQRLGEGSVSEAFKTWLDAGDAPVFFGFGSMPIRDPSVLLHAIAEVTRTRGLRALIGAGWSEYSGRDLPPHVFVAPVFDYDAVFARCRAAVHHGGSGTTAASLRAGLPTFVTSMISDQAFWGWRVQQLGVGTTLPFQKLNRRRLGRALDVLLSEPTQRRARELGAKLRAERGAQCAADVVERWGRDAGQASTRGDWGGAAGYRS